MISNKTIHAINVCVMLAGQRQSGYLTTTDISPRLGLSVSYLESILKCLKAHDLVLALRGPGGGYMINGDVSRISMWDVACIFEQTRAQAQEAGEDSTYQAYERALEELVIQTLKSSSLSDYPDYSAFETNAYAETVGQFKLKPLPLPLIPKAPNSVFQLGMVF